MKNAIKNVLCLFVLSCSVANAQDIIPKMSGNIATAGILSVSASNPLQTVNPSMSSLTESMDFTVGYTLPYHLTDLQQIVAKGAFAFPWVTLSVNVSKSGNGGSTFSRFGGALSRKFGIVGIGMEYNAVIHQLPCDERAVSSFSCVGFHVIPNDMWTLSVAVNNVEERGFDYEYYDFDIESYLFAGVKWRANKIVTLLCEAEKEWDHDGVYKASVVVNPCKVVTASVGFSTLGQSISAGVGYCGKLFNIHVGISHHEQLGVTSSASVSMSNIFKKE